MKTKYGQDTDIGAVTGLKVLSITQVCVYK